MKYKGTVIIAFALLLLFLGSFFIPSLKMESSENRTMATFGMVFNPETDSVVYHDSPVERLDAALSDQFAFREFFVKRYLWLFNQSENIATQLAQAVKLEKPHYLLQAVGNYALIGDTGYITGRESTDYVDADLIQEHADQIETLHGKFPDLKMYVYYVSQAFDACGLESQLGLEPVDYYKMITDTVPEYVKTGRLVYEDLDDYMNIHYKTDHHWNHRGAYRGYQDIFSMMSEDMDMGEIRVPLSENNVSQKYDFVFIGSFGRALGDLYDGYDDFSFYEYDLPDRKLAILDPDTLEETEAVKIGLYDEYRDGKMDRGAGKDHYIRMYGTARDVNGNSMIEEGLYIIRNSKGNGKNLLICGDSYFRAVRDVLASHFDTTVYFDYRLLSKLPIEEVIERYDIDALLIGSNTSMWCDRYFFTFRGDE